jgi:hypothetical protein
MSIPGGIATCALVAAVALSSVALLSTPAFAAKESAVIAACKRTPGCWFDKNKGVGRTIGCSPHACFDCINGVCKQAIKTTPGQVQRDPNAVVTTPKSARGSIPIQTGATAVVNTTHVRQGTGSSTGGKGGKR